MQLLNNLSASPIYAAKWKRGEQTLLLYGDLHNTHKIFGEKEHHLANKFIMALSKVPNKTLFLTEDYLRPSIHFTINEKCLTCLKNYEDIYLQEEKFHPFISIVNRYTRNQNNMRLIPYVNVASVDMRTKSMFNASCFTTHEAFQQLRLDYLAPKEGTYVPDEAINSLKYLQTIILTWNEALQNLPLQNDLMLPIQLVDTWIQSSTESTTIKIFNQIRKQLDTRLKALHETLIKKYGFTAEELASITLADVCCNAALDEEGTGDWAKYARYHTIVEIFASHIKWFNVIKPFLFIDYECDIVEACALRHISSSHNKAKKIVILMGAHHVFRLETYLAELGYEKIDYIETINRLQCEFYENKLLELLSSKIKEPDKFIGDKTDKFCLLLHHSLDAKAIKIDYINALTRINNIQKPSSLMSPKAFSWIYKDEKKPYKGRNYLKKMWSKATSFFA